MNLSDFKRIMILGNNGSGKSYFAKECSAITGLPLIHLDAEFWRPNWGMPTEGEWRRKITGFVSKEEWILDGMCDHGGTIELRFAAADLVIFLDAGRLTCLMGVLKRQGKKRTDTAVNHHFDEKFDKRFLHFCKGIWCFPKSSRRNNIMALHRKYADKPFFMIHGRREMNRLLRQWKERQR